ncbi:hypothetical protein LCGC14_1467220 [marine sediment metagenome]|uniref:Uncharacterized protein n=1 Tax=marine sediment metagenome TaxID=412755 RepID=A0A0F9MFC7_9ZZZZ
MKKLSTKDDTTLLIDGQRHIWVCPQGHNIVQTSPFTVQASDADGEVYDTGPICQHCLVKSIHDKFPITDLGEET